jgi:hypothetical protein
MGYLNTKGERLHLDNLEGFVAKPIKGKLRRCNRGYHAGTLRGWFGVNSIKEWKEESAHRRNLLCEVKLIHVPSIKDGLVVEKGQERQGIDGKWVGRSFKIIRRVA